MALDLRLPLDTLFMVFEEDYRFFPDGQDIDNADDYRVRMVKLLEERKKKGLQDQESLPPPDRERTADWGKGSEKGKARPESRFHATPPRGSSDLKDTVNEGFSSNVADLVRWATFADRMKMGNLMWLMKSYKIMNLSVYLQI